MNLVGTETLQKFCWIGGITFLDAKGFKFHLPAYLVTAIRTSQLGDIVGIMISNLTNPGDNRAKGFQLFSKPQKRAVLNAVL